MPCLPVHLDCYKLGPSDALPVGLVSLVCSLLLGLFSIPILLLLALFRPFSCQKLVHYNALFACVFCCSFPLVLVPSRPPTFAHTPDSKRLAETP